MRGHGLTDHRRILLDVASDTAISLGLELEVIDQPGVAGLAEPGFAHRAQRQSVLVVVTPDAKATVLGLARAAHEAPAAAAPGETSAPTSTAVAACALSAFCWYSARWQLPQVASFTATSKSGCPPPR